MDLSVATVAETLTREFPDLGFRDVVTVLAACADENPGADSHFIEQAARARLALLAHPQRTAGAPAGPDALDVSLHDNELATEVELTARLMVAANESEHDLTTETVDRILDVAGAAPTVSASVPAFPLQRGGHS